MRCTRCNQDKELEAFPRRGEKRRQPCLACKSEQNAEYYLNNKDATRERNARTKERLTLWYRSLKERPCSDCGHSYPHYVMQWDHLPEYEKIRPVAEVLQYTWSRTAVLAEIAKCELVCANCHAERTYQRNAA